MEGKYTHVVHGFEPVFDERSRVLVLGSLPSVKSREQGFYYGHPQNRFWRVTAAVFGEAVPPVTIPEKKAFLLRRGVALWDVIAECDIIGSADSSIRNVVPADLSQILDAAPIRAIFANGGTAERLYIKYQQAATGRGIIKLPSTSPANAAWNIARLTEAWRTISDFSG
ncbi:MAG: DNA-deoxyinosine glycosylase [Ruminococcus sp.]|nr:DNA-deoxyinosine glycosylase [Ruminococcus sp.]